jgi:hypothetical protein
VEWAAIQWERNMVEEKGRWKIFFMNVRKGGDERGSGNHVKWEMISSDYVERRGGDC